MNKDTLLTKYRPESFDSVLGQDTIIKSLKDSKARVYLFSGPSGVGKTTLGRIIAKNAGCNDNEIIEKDAAAHSSIEQIRELVELDSYMPRGPARAFIIDECHRLRKDSFDTLLKTMEESKHSYWILLSSEPEKVPSAVKTRSAHYDLKPVAPKLILDLLERVSKAEGFATSKAILSYIAVSAKGSPRQALNYLAATHNLTSVQEAKDIIGSADTENLPVVVELGRTIMSGGNRAFEDAVNIIKNNRDADPISIKYGIINYFTTVCLNAGDISKRIYALRVIDAFSRPFDSAEKFGPLLLALGSVLIEE